MGLACLFERIASSENVFGNGRLVVAVNDVETASRQRLNDSTRRVAVVVGEESLRSAAVDLAVREKGGDVCSDFDSQLDFRIAKLPSVSFRLDLRELSRRVDFQSTRRC